RPIVFEASKFASYDGRSRPAESGKLSVPENRRRPGRVIHVAFLRLRTSALEPRPPIVFLAGGPGIPGIGMAQVPVYYDLFNKLNEFADVILLDQRGSGTSSPNLSDCPADAAFPADALADVRRLESALAQSTAACAHYWKDRGIDLSGYNN